jgi:hypothetical protein
MRSALLEQLARAFAAAHLGGAGTEAPTFG